MSPNEGKKYQKLSNQGKAAYAADVSAEARTNAPRADHPIALKKLLDGYYDTL